ncbi:LysM peptidoglycan-binding domain-containing protein [Bacillus sp. FJAT-49736]|uniref:LysM peptidoglycan-binding domain-containing protein n=1 Tax=Bacillus sp. FJAT-49736 TaxID=2833582 RepID=UPI001BC96E02|nr:LysM peptidoglycan-binding domain-containing protein [Bacillus sp. FJAT-49736]MBS4172127.1 LysM peptidoglycan-binding domain-containing protein [Bacillus sp. FJAT-49736]
MSEYGIWLSYNNEKEGFQFPENPPEIEFKDSSNNTIHNISNIGEINVIKDPKLTDITFSGNFPASNHPYVVTDKLLSPKKYKDYINKWKASKKPIRFIYTGSTFDINILVSIEEFTYKESGGSVGDIEYTISLKKYVSYAAQKVKIAKSSSKKSSSKKNVAIKSSKTRSNNKQQPKVYKLVKGDSLWKVAQKFLGSGSRWPEIQKLNNIPTSKLKKLPIGMSIKIPPK